MKVFIVMGNDFPATVFATEQGAEDFCTRSRESQKKVQELAKAQNPHSYFARIYWRVYDFEVNP